MAESNLSNLPKGWACTSLNEVSEIILGQSPPSSTYNESGEGLPFYQGKLEFGDIYPSPRKWCSEPKKIAGKGDVLISVRAPVGPTNLCPEKSCIGRGLAAIRGLGGIQPHFILYLIRAFEKVIAGSGTGTTFDAITGDQLKNFPVPLPPLPEQQRIVAKIEELFSDLEVGVDALKKAKAQLKLYRQAVLKAAFEGRLTAAWRELNFAELDHASVPMEIIKEERKKHFKGKVKKLPPINISALRELPEKWIWTRLNDISEKITDGTHFTPNYTVHGIPFISVKDIYNGKIHFDKCKYISEIDHGQLIRRCHPEYIDILITKSGTIGRTAVVTTDKTFSLFVSVALIKPVKGFTNSDYINYGLNEYINKIDIKQSVKGGVIKNLHIEDLKEIIIPFPPINEQQRIVEKIEYCFSLSDETEKAIDHNIKTSERLRQSILKQAFSGRLVPQDPEDEPAAELLERLKTENAVQPAGRRSRAGLKRPAKLW